jgi:hypothetical protein
VSDADALQTLDAALAALDPRRVSWLDMTVAQEVHLPDLDYQTAGRYRAAPDNRFRLELQMRTGKTTETYLTVSDGACVWRATRAGDGDWTAVRRFGFQQVLDAAEATPQARDDFLRGPSFSGPMALLRNLRRRMVWVDSLETRDGERAVIALTGVWPPETVAKLAPKDAEWPAGCPDRCRVFLDADTLAPCRVEWWGPADQGKSLIRLVQIELGGVVVNQPLTQEECERTFRFDPGSAPVIDETKPFSDEYGKKAAP